MPIQISMPAVSPSMTVGRLTRWLVRPGDRIDVGDVIAEVETGSVTMEVEAVDGGVIAALLVAAGQADVRVGAPIATIVVGGAPRSEPLSAREVPEAPSPGRRRASPLARRLAREAEIDLAAVTGSGPGGRVVKRDIDAVVARRQVTSPGPAAPATVRRAVTSTGSGRAVAVHGDDRLREIVVEDDARASGPAVRVTYAAERYRVVAHGAFERGRAEVLEQAARTVPQFVLRCDCRMEEVERARARMNGGIVPRTGKALALTDLDFVVKAMALALQQVPAANVSWSADAMLHHAAADISVVIAAPDGTVTALVADAQSKSLHEISDEIRDNTERARSGRGDALYEVGAVSVHTFATAAAGAFECMVVPPRSAALALGQVETRPIVSDGAIVAGRVVSCALACDQRAIEPGVAAALLAVFKSLVEDPLRMLV